VCEYDLAAAITSHTLVWLARNKQSSSMATLASKLQEALYAFFANRAGGVVAAMLWFPPPQGLRVWGGWVDSLLQPMPDGFQAIMMVSRERK
jgi:hypothetical protein